MLQDRLVPNINIFSDLSSVRSLPTGDFSKNSFGINPMKNSDGADFKSVLSGLISNVNNEVQKPDQLLSEQMSGNSEVDIHDVMTAISKAELGVTVATQVTSKIITAYNSVMQISI